MNISLCRVGGVLTLALAIVASNESARAQNAEANPLRAATSEQNLRSPVSNSPAKSTPVKTAPAKKTPVQPATAISSEPVGTGRQPQSTPGTEPARFQLANHPGLARVTTHSHTGEGAIIESGPMEYMEGGDIIFDTDVKGGGKGGDCCGGVGCNQCLIPCPRFSLDNFEFSGGVHGFTGPVNRGQTGSFGFHEGFNWGAPMPCLGTLGVQFGVNGIHSNFSAAERTDESRNQLFATAGLFRRVDWGLQGGIVLDYLSDDWYADYEVRQLRGELSWVFPCAHELGFWFTSSQDEFTTTSTLDRPREVLTETFEAIDLAAFFYRHRFAELPGAQARFYAGFTGDSDGLIGGDLRLPLSCDFALECAFTYLVPEEATAAVPIGGHQEEGWNVAIGFVWFPGARTANSNDYCRPLFNVADNGSFITGLR